MRARSARAVARSAADALVCAVTNAAPAGAISANTVMLPIERPSEMITPASSSRSTMAR